MLIHPVSVEGRPTAGSTVTHHVIKMDELIHLLGDTVKDST
jgi:hypothetical protein